ncbi:Rho termination factor N-terminal domain-containing protein [Micromonospora sp. LOL_024]|uniref:Rho termination factor N-terminal domain-containing protein n=1 Tax=Micromonospora sp. LOL_024 TaxID=3345412 RepID=UPI003A8A3697
MTKPIPDMDTAQLRHIAVTGGIQGAPEMDRQELIDALLARPGEGAWQEDPKPADVNPNDYRYQAPEQD